MTMGSNEPSSSGGGVEQNNRDEKLSATSSSASLQNLPLRSGSMLDCSTEKVAGAVAVGYSWVAFQRILHENLFQLDDSGDSDKHMVGDDSSGPNALDLNSLLKNLESEILVNEQNLNDENDRRYMFKVCWLW